MFPFQGIPCFFQRFSLLSQGFHGFVKDKKSLSFCWFALLFSKKTQGKWPEIDFRAIFPISGPFFPRFPGEAKSIFRPFLSPFRAGGPNWICTRSTGSQQNLQSRGAGGEQSKPGDTTENNETDLQSSYPSWVKIALVRHALARA